MKTEITRRFTFESMHNIPDHPGKCRFLHGHSYKLYITLTCDEIPAIGYFIDFGEVKGIVDHVVVERLDHTNLNEIIFPVASAENIASWIWERLVNMWSETDISLVRVRLWETENCYVDVTA